MKQKTNTSFILAAGISCALFACNQKGQTDDQAKTGDTSEVVKKETDQMPAYDPERSVTKISPALYKQLSDTLNVRVLEGTYNPGDSSTLHSHPDFVLYVLQEGTVELTATDGTKQTIEFKPGMGLILPATTHSAKNTGSTTIKLLVVEVNRPRM